MIRLFKDLKKEYYITELFGIIFLLGTNFYIYGKTGNKIIYMVIIIMAIIYIAAVANVFTRRALKRMVELRNKAKEKTNLEETIKQYENILERAKKGKIKTHIITTLTDLYIKTNNTEKALELYEDFTPSFDKDEAGILSKIVYLQNLCKILITAKVYDLAKENLSIIKRLRENKKLSTISKNSIEVVYNDLVVELVLKENKDKNYKKIEEYYLKRFNEEENDINKVFIAYQLSKVYSKLKKKREEKKYKKYYDENRCDIQFN